jgi:DNA-binding transcriptional ArsR family regulator
MLIVEQQFNNYPMTREILPLETATDLADLFNALSDPTRIRIIALLVEGEIGFSELVEQLGLSVSAVSHQLRGLRDKRLVRTRKVGRNVFICMDDEHVVELFKRGLDHASHG